MKVQELRKLLESAERKNIEKAFVECYKLLRKVQKEENDPMLTALLEGRAAEATKAEAPADFEALAGQVADFISNANAGNYLAPNRIIPKNQRPKWRFQVKKFIKELSKVPLDNDNYEKSTKLLTDLYCLICEGCNVYLFSTDDPFRSIGWEQPDLFDLVVTKNFADGISRAKITQLLTCAVSGGLSRESVNKDQEIVLLRHLKISDVKYMAMEEAKKLVEEKEEELAALKKYDRRQYELESTVNELCNMIFLITIELGESEAGVQYFFAHYKQATKEITLYCALDLAYRMGEDELWLKVYEYGLRKKIKPRDSLRRIYEERKKEIL